MLDWKYRPKTEAEKSESAERKAEKEQIAEETPEGFASKNAKTITFTVMLILFLAFFGPISVFTVYRQITDAREQEGVVMTEADLVTLGSLGDALTLDHLRGYQGTESENDQRINYIVYLDGYVLLTMHDKASGALSICPLTDAETNDSIDIRYEDVEAFLASH
ncbi:MAG: hypothetical protein IKC59_03670 [Clostridia bacterium]|nr:hypothetical protein [Clostridia bacterium]